MSVMVKDSLGRWVQAAGQGKAEYGASTERKGDITIPATTAGNFQTVNVIFAQAMPDNDYTVIIDEGGNTWAHCTTNVTNKTATGFTLFFLNVAGADAPQMTFKYRAFKLYTDTEYNQVLAALPPVDAVTDGNMKAVTSNAVYDALSNVVVTTADVVADGNMNPVTSNAVYDALHPANPYSDWTILWTASGNHDYLDNGEDQDFVAGKIVNNVVYLSIYADSQRTVSNILPAEFCPSTPNPASGSGYNTYGFSAETWKDPTSPQLVSYINVSFDNSIHKGSVSWSNANGSYTYPIVINYPL